MLTNTSTPHSFISCKRNSVLQETVHVSELVNTNLCFVCVSCLSVCVFLFVLFGVIGTGYIRRGILCIYLVCLIQASREPFMCMNL